MDTFFHYLDFAPTMLQGFVKAFSAIAEFMLTTVNIAGTDYSILSLMLGNGVIIYLGFTLAKYLVPV